MEAVTIHPVTEATRIQDLSVGDEVSHLGMHLRVLEAPRQSRVHPTDGPHGLCFVARTECLNAQAVIDQRLVPAAWLREEGGRGGVEFGWVLQGNDLGKVRRIVS